MQSPLQKITSFINRVSSNIHYRFKYRPIRHVAIVSVVIIIAIVLGIYGMRTPSTTKRISLSVPNTNYGLAAMTNYSQLSLVRPGTLAGGQSSFDRNTQDGSQGNSDYNNFLSVTNGEKVMLDQKGPGTVYRIWVTGFNPSTDWIKVYFDGETTPRINMLMKDMFAGTNAPFLSPLVVDNTKSSGGFVSYLPLPYASSVKITTNMSNYYNVGYHTFTAGTPIATWTGNEDSSAARNQWSNVGTDPKNTTGDTVASGAVSLAPSGTQTILNVAGARTIDSVRVSVPNLNATSTATDNGRAFTGFSQFTMNVNPSNTGVTLSRRLDYSIADQKANVYIDGVNAGAWYDAGSNTAHQWRDSSFTIPANLTAGKSSITIKIQFTSSALDWNEFTYWTYSTINNGPSLSDTLDVGDAASEAAHHYTVSGQTWSGNRTFTYDTADILNNTYIRMYWDGETTPSVNAPLGSFFAMGQFGAYGTKGIVAGMDSSNTMYLYLPMPFQNHATIQLVSTRSIATNNITYEIKHQAFTGDMAKNGYFHTQLTTTAPGVSGKDLPILNTTGSGTFIGVTASYTGDTTRSYLEGDERIYVDDNASPAFQGTGTEDFFNGGWYFQDGTYSGPMSGNTAHIVTSTSDMTAAYRFFLQDAVPFHRHIVASIQHGGHDETTNSATMLAYYYQNQTNGLNLTDTLHVGQASSESAHHYTVSGQTWSGNRTFTYDGTSDTVNVADNGRAFTGFSQFTMNVNPSNTGVILRRRLDQSIANQQANVYVDGQLVGPWYTAGSEAYHNWRDSDLLIPASFTSGKSSITIKIQFTSSALDWNEFTYWTYSIST